MQVLDNVQWPDEMPWSAEDFQRYDESSDGIFYSQPRFVTHIDDGAIGALTECALGSELFLGRAILLFCWSAWKTQESPDCRRFYGTQLPPAGSQDAAVLDLCSRYAAPVHSQLLRKKCGAVALLRAQPYTWFLMQKVAACSWISHYPKGYSAGRVSGKRSAPVPSLHAQPCHVPSHAARLITTGMCCAALHLRPVLCCRIGHEWRRAQAEFGADGHRSSRSERRSEAAVRGQQFRCARLVACWLVSSMFGCDMQQQVARSISHLYGFAGHIQLGTCWQLRAKSTAEALMFSQLPRRRRSSRTRCPWTTSRSRSRCSGRCTAC